MDAILKWRDAMAAKFAGWVAYSAFKALLMHPPASTHPLPDASAGRLIQNPIFDEFFGPVSRAWLLEKSHVVDTGHEIEWVRPDIPAPGWHWDETWCRELEASRMREETDRMHFFAAVSGD